MRRICCGTSGIFLSYFKFKIYQRKLFFLLPLEFAAIVGAPAAVLKQTGFFEDKWQNTEDNRAKRWKNVDSRWCCCSVVQHWNHCISRLPLTGDDQHLSSVSHFVKTNFLFAFESISYNSQGSLPIIFQRHFIFREKWPLHMLNSKYKLNWTARTVWHPCFLVRSVHSNCLCNFMSRH